MSNNNNLLTEISALVLAALLIIGGVVLLYTGKIDYANSVFFFVTALGLFGFNSAWKAPSPAQTQLLAQLVSQQQAASSGGGQPQVQPAPGQMFTTPVPQAPINTTTTYQPLQMTYQPSSTFPVMPSIPGGSQ